MSNIAWDPADDSEVAAVLRGAGVDAVEVAPTKRWPDPRTADVQAARDERFRWHDLGLDVVSTQSLLFGRPELALFGAPDVRRTFVQYLSHVVALGGALGARAQVFGSPRNRRREDLPPEQAFDIAVSVFHDVADVAEAAGTTLVIEANPAEYGADFLTSSHEAAALVEAVDRPGVRLHLDTACMLLAGDDPTACVHRYAHLLAHVHLSEPELGPVGESESAAHVAVLHALAEVGYEGNVSVEMRPTATAVASVGVAAAYAVELLARRSA